MLIVNDEQCLRAGMRKGHLLVLICGWGRSSPVESVSIDTFAGPQLLQ